MKTIYIKIEKFFEKITYLITTILGSSITFFLAFVMVVFWFFNRQYSSHDINEVIRDLIHGVTFLSLFVIQKEFSRFSGSLHLKVNELVASTETASNSVINVESKTEIEIQELQKEYAELAEKIEDAKE
ncbi:MAG: low affinity iron permease family protein [Leadbetterella sp.]|jgi:low affinity Fe/Cu permease|nr:low affinity iron permease family protein [Leadbetterella sp.]